MIVFIQINHCFLISFKANYLALNYVISNKFKMLIEGRGIINIVFIHTKVDVIIV